MQRFLLSLTFLGALAVAGCTPAVTNQPTAGAPATASPGAASPAASADASVTIRVLDFELEPSTLSVTGSTISIAVSNSGPTVHNVTIRDAEGTVVAGTRDLREKESETFTAAIAPGSYVLFCSLAGHESLGMKGSLTVAAP